MSAAYKAAPAGGLDSTSDAAPGATHGAAPDAASVCGRVKVKLCGLRRAEDIAATNEVKPDYAGFVVECPGSPRSVSAEDVQMLSDKLDPRIRAVGVFVDADPQTIVQLYASGAISVAQLHGSEDDAYIKTLREAVSNEALRKAASSEALRKAAANDEPHCASNGEQCEAVPRKPLGGGLEIWKAFRVRTQADVEAACRITADIVLLDSGAGSGETFDWELVKHVGRSFVLAGGLHSGNVGRAIASVRPYAVDLSSGIETGGVKDPIKMKAVVTAVRSCQMGKGRYGVHGGQYIPETLMNAVGELEEAYSRLKDDPEFNRELLELLDGYAGRPSRLYYAGRMTEDLGGAKIYLKREDLNHTGAHKVNNALGQALLAKKMGKTRLIAETGAGQHGVATATAAALLGMECVVYMGREDTERQALNVYKMRLLGAEVHPVDDGTATLKDAVSATFREWTRRIDDTHYCLGSVMGPHPFPMIVRDFQAVISREIKQQMLEREGRLPDTVVACVGGGSNAIGSFYHFIEDESVELVGCEAAGRGIDTFETAATISTGKLGIFHGMKSYFCQDEFGQIAPVYSISAGLDYPGVGPEHAMLHDSGRAKYVAITDDEAVDAFEYLSRMEGIIPAIESSHALAWAIKAAPKMSRDKIMVVTVSGRGDKDCAAIARYRGEDIHE